MFTSSHGVGGRDKGGGIIGEDEGASVAGKMGTKLKE